MLTISPREFINLIKGGAVAAVAPAEDERIGVIGRAPSISKTLASVARLAPSAVVGVLPAVASIANHQHVTMFSHGAPVVVTDTPADGDHINTDFARQRISINHENNNKTTVSGCVPIYDDFHEITISANVSCLNRETCAYIGLAGINLWSIGWYVMGPNVYANIPGSSPALYSIDNHKAAKLSIRAAWFGFWQVGVRVEFANDAKNKAIMYKVYNAKAFANDNLLRPQITLIGRGHISVTDLTVMVN